MLSMQDLTESWAIDGLALYNYKDSFQPLNIDHYKESLFNFIV